MSAWVVAPPRGAAELDRAASLLGAILRPEQPDALREEHPAIFGGAASGELLVSWDGERPLGGAAIVVRRAITPRGELRLGLVGSVATDPAARGRGVARAVLESCEGALRERGCVAALLWADVPTFYQRCGYVGAGSEVLLLIPRSAPLPKAESCALATPADWDALERLRRREPARSDRPIAESRAHFGAPGTSIHVHRDGRGAIDAYVAYERGADLRGAIHESAGAFFGILASIRHVLETRGREFVVYLADPHRKDLLEYAMVRGLEIHHGILGMAKGLDAAALCDALEVHLPGGLTATAMGNGARIARGSAFLELDGKDLLRALLGHQGSREPLERIERAFALDPIEALPLTPFLSGFDSI